ncbi:hypothetical protein [Deinococcus aquiradiocola]|uniref:hypothetical protein n=1 Tax=Deinococcus aquiradiocola TaxID=393059 RepID=UPI001663A090|nr:hypothetical protein [Deinococcus aquiradiocola]
MPGRSADVLQFMAWDVRHTLRGLIPDRTLRRLVAGTVVLGSLFLAFVFSVALLHRAPAPGGAALDTAGGFLLTVAFLGGILSLKLIGDFLDVSEEKFTLLALAPVPASLSVLLGITGVVSVGFIPLLLFVVPLGAVLLIVHPSLGLTTLLTCVTVYGVVLNAVILAVNVLVTVLKRSKAQRVINFSSPLLGLAGLAFVRDPALLDWTARLDPWTLLAALLISTAVLTGQMRVMRHLLLVPQVSDERSPVSWTAFPWWKLAAREGGPLLVAGSLLFTVLVSARLGLTTPNARTLIALYVLNIPVFTLVGRALKDELQHPSRLSLFPDRQGVLRQLEKVMLRPLLISHLALLLATALSSRHVLWGAVTGLLLLPQLLLAHPARYARLARPLSLLNLVVGTLASQLL